MAARLLLASALALLGAQALAQSVTETGNFIRVPPVWSAPTGADLSPYPWISALAVCQRHGNQPPGELKDFCAEIGDKPVTDFQAFTGRAVKSLVELNVDCRKAPGSTGCPAYFVAARPAMAGREKVSILQSEQEDRDLDGSQRPAPAADNPAATTAEARFIEGLTGFVLDRAKLEAIAYFEERFHNQLCEASAEQPRVAYFTSVCHVLDNSRRAGFSLASASREMRAAARRDLRALPDAALHQQYINSADPLYVMQRVWLSLAARMRDNSLVATDAFSALANINPEICRRDAKWTDAAAKDEELRRFVHLATARLAKAVRPARYEPPAGFDKLTVQQRAEALRAQLGLGPELQALKLADLARELVVRECGESLQALAIMGAGLAFVSQKALQAKPEAKLRVAHLIDATVLAFQEKLPAESGREPADFAAKFVPALDALASLSTDIGAFTKAAGIAQDKANEARKEHGAKRDALLREFGAELATTADHLLGVIDNAVLAFAGCEHPVCRIDGEEIRRRSNEGIRVARQNARLARDVLNDQWVVVAVEIARLYLTRSDAPAGALVGQYAPVIAEIAGAKTSVEVQKILNDAAAPAGTYREKFRGNTRSLGALVGFGAGKEWYRSDEVWESGDIFGLFAPIGIHVTTPTRFGSALGVFGSLLDLGPYATSRESAEGVSKNTDVEFKQLFSPGIYLTWSISCGKPSDMFYRSPFVVGFGIAKTPALLKTTSGQEIDSTRALVFIAIDVTIFPF